jgi:Periplasmic copper-binding protein (NosD)
MKSLPVLIALVVAMSTVQPAMAGQIVAVPSAEAGTIALAMIKAMPGDTVLVANGVYPGGVMLKSDVVLKSASVFGAALDGGGKGAVVTMGSNASLCGFEIRNGTIGILSSHGGNAVLSCRITGNRESGIMCVGNVPRIEDNVIVFNGGSGIQGWNLSATSETVNHNTIAYNMNNGVALGGNSNMILECNIIAFNQNEAVKSLDPTKTSMTNNDFYKNGRAPSTQPSNNFSLDPNFTAPRSGFDFSLAPDSPLKSTMSGMNVSIGARSPNNK